MKKLLMSMVIVTFLISCGGNTNSDGDGNNPPAKNGTNNGTNNGTQNETNNKNAPCNKPVAGDGSQPTPLPVC